MNKKIFAARALLATTGVIDKYTIFRKKYYLLNALAYYIASVDAIHLQLFESN
jgi:hypothetical protein